MKNDTKTILFSSPLKKKKISNFFSAKELSLNSLINWIFLFAEYRTLNVYDISLSRFDCRTILYFLFDKESHFRNSINFQAHTLLQNWLLSSIELDIFKVIIWKSTTNTEVKEKEYYKYIKQRWFLMQSTNAHLLGYYVFTILRHMACNNRKMLETIILIKQMLKCENVVFFEMR